MMMVVVVVILMMRVVMSVDLQSGRKPCTSHTHGTVILSKMHSKKEEKPKLGSKRRNA